MCEYDPRCTVSDNAEAQKLWSRPARAVVVCDTKKWHPLAKVFDLGPDRGGLHLCQRAHSELLTPEGWDKDAHFHWDLVSLDELERMVNAGETWQLELGRCPCGTWQYTLAHIHNAMGWGGQRNRKGVAVVRADRVTSPIARSTTRRRDEPERG